MINQLMGFFSSPRQLLKGWEIPLAGLLLTAGLAATATTIKTTSQQPAKATNSLDSTAVLPSLETKTPQQEQAADSTTTAPKSEVAAVQPQELASNAATSAPTSEATVTQSPEPAANSTTADPASEAATPQSPEPALDSTTSASTTEAGIPQSPEPMAAAEVNSKGHVKAAAMPSAKWNRQAQETKKPNLAQAPNSAASIPDGTYLYGQSSQPGQLGKEYIVFQARQSKVVGAMYMPNSEYACFYGTLNSKQLNLTVVNPYDQTAFAHTIARQQTSQVAAASGSIHLNNSYDSLSYPHSVGLEGYQPINQVSDNDQQILSNCMSKYQAKL